MIKFSSRILTMTAAAGLAALMGSGAANAGAIPGDDPEPVITLTLAPGAEPLIQQTFNNPCFIGDESCSPGLLINKTVFPAGGGVTDYDLNSPVYTVELVLSIAGSSFDIGIDTNTAGSGPNGASENIQLFEIWLSPDNIMGNSDDFVTAVFIDLDPDNPNIAPPAANGTGFADFLLSGIDLSMVPTGYLIWFHLVLDTATDGREQFFLVGDPDDVEIPEPITATLFGLGLLGLGAAGGRRKKKAA